jgi:hypothetical protein
MKPEPITEPFRKCETMAPPPERDYARSVVLVTLKLSAHTVPELYHVTGIPVATLSRIITGLMRERVIRTVHDGSHATATKFIAVDIDQSLPAIPGFLPLVSTL